MDVTDLINRMDPDMYWNSRERRIAGEVIRQWLMSSLNMNTAREGRIYKRNWDAPPEDTVDPFTGEAVDTRGSEWVSDQYIDEGLFYINIKALGGSSRDIQYPRGLQDVNVLQGIAVMSPRVEGGDLWKDARSGLIYIMRPVEYKAKVGGIPLVGQMTMFELPEDRPEYNLDD